MEKQLGTKLDIYTIVRDVLRQWWVVLFFGAALALFANIYVTYQYQPEYTTRTTFAVTAKNSSSSIYQDMTSAKNTASRFMQVLNSNVMEKAVREDLGVEKLNASTTVEQVEETNLIQLSVTSTSSLQAYRIIRSIMNNYSSVSDYVMSSVVLEVIEEPSLPMAPSNSLNVRPSMTRAFIIGVLIMVAYVSIRSYSRDTVKTEEQLKEKIDAKSLGTIYHEKNKISKRKRKKNSVKYSMLINNPLRSFSFVEQNRLVASRVHSRMDKQGAKVVLVTSVMENEGKSTVAANVALGIASEGKNVLLIDGDFRKPSQYRIFNVSEEEQTNLTYQLMRGQIQPDIIHRYHDTSLFLLANNKAARSPDGLQYAKGLREIIDSCWDQIDYIILDTAPMALVADTEDLAALADMSIIVVREDEVLAKKINDAIDQLNNARCPVLGCVFSNVRKRQGKKSGYSGYYGKYRSYGGYYGKSEK